MPSIPLFPSDVLYKRQKNGYYAVYYFNPAPSDLTPRCCIYIRVSSRQQSTDDKHSLPEQWRLNWEAAGKQGYAVVAVYIEVLSGSSRYRKAYQQMLTDGRTGKYKAIFATMNDRLFRSMWSAADLEEMIEQHSIELFGSVEPIDKELLGLFAWVASRERRNIATRTRMGREAAARENRIPSGKPPFYLRVIRNEQNKPDHIELDPYYSLIIKEFCRRYITTELVRSIVRDLFKDVPRPTGDTKYGWTLQYLNQILRSSTLYGKWQFKDYTIDVPALIDKEMWDQVQLAIKRRRSSPVSGRPSRIPTPFAKILFCKVCGQAMTSHARDWDYIYHRLKNGTKKRYKVNYSKPKIKYICGGMSHYSHVYRCRKPEYVRNEYLFPKVWDKLHNGLAYPELITVGIRKMIEQLENSDEQVDLNTIEKRLAKIEQKMLSYSEQRAEGAITPEQHRELTMRLNDDKQSLLEEKVRLTSKSQRIKDAQEMLAYVEPVAKKMAEKMQDLDNEEKTIFIRAACYRIWVDGQNEVELELSLPGLEAYRVNGSPALQGNITSLLPESEPSNGSQKELLDTTNEARYWDLSKKVRYTRNRGCRRC